jgi:hypothetical protein
MRVISVGRETLFPFVPELRPSGTDCAVASPPFATALASEDWKVTWSAWYPGVSTLAMLLLDDAVERELQDAYRLGGV